LTASSFGIKSIGVILLFMFVGTFKLMAGEEPEYDQQFYLDRAYQALESGEQVVDLKRAKENLEILKFSRDQRNNVHVRFRQMVEGVPVWGKEILVHMREDGTVYNVGGYTIAEANTNLPEVKITPEQCAGIIQELSAGKYAKATIRAPELYVDVVDGMPRKVYKVEVLMGLKREFLFVDANSGELVKRMSGSPNKKMN
jgi:Zn-dependent metalloprotease